MTQQLTREQPRPWLACIRTLFALAVCMAQPALALTINVVDPQGSPVSGFRYLVELDTSHPVTAGAKVANSLALGLHRSYAPVAVTNGGPAAEGRVAGQLVNLDLPANTRYVVSVLPDSGYSNASATVPVNQETVTVTVQPLPLPTAQISIFVFKDDSPINDIPDQPQETGLAGFTVQVSDAAGQVLQDVFGNPLGTTYRYDTTGRPLLRLDGTPIVIRLGSGVIKTDANGDALVKYLAPGKYGVTVVPPVGEGWQQTNTIEGTRTIDAWVRADEPAVFGEFGPPNRHVFFGFVKPFNNLAAGTGSISGRVVNAHNSRPPNFTFNPGHPLPNCWIGLNEVSSRKGVLAQPCNADSSFNIANVPPGEYRVAVWDAYLNSIFSEFGVTVPPAGGPVALGDVEVFRWFGYLDNRVFFDRNQNGFRNCYTPLGTPSARPEDCDNSLVDDIGFPGQNINLRFRDGSIYQALATDTTGHITFEEVFPFFRFLIAEVDYARYKATGATIIADGGGPVTPDRGWDYPSHGRLAPQPQCGSLDAAGACINPQINPNTGNNLSRTVTGPVLLQAVGTLPGLTNVIEWGKGVYAPGENGGISGIVYYATTRAENNPRFGVGDPWEPGVPRVQVNLYLDRNRDGRIDDLNGNGITLADVDNHPFGNFPGVEDIDRNNNRSFDAGDAVQIVTSDSWDDNLPTGCQSAPYSIYGVQAQDCFEGLRNFNQVRDGVFDGGYAFNSYHPGGIASGSAEVTLPAGSYIVEATTPPGYRHVKEEDRNVDFGDAATPAPLLLPPYCVGDNHVVPATLSLFPGVPAAYAGQSRPLCDRKQVVLNSGRNAAADFFVYTEVPKAARVVGLLLNDFANVFDPNHPNYGEKAPPPWVPISIQDWAGREVLRTYSDEFGAYNAMVPSTYTTNVPSPTGVSPNMLRVCLNHPGPIPNPTDTNLMITDPYFDPGLSQACYTFDAWPGKTTYLDTPVLPMAASTSRMDYPLDCEPATATPVIHEVRGPNGGPYVAAPGEFITITAATLAGQILVRNPAFSTGGPAAQMIPRDYGFGTTPGTVTLNGVPLANVSWGDVTILAQVPVGAQSGQLVVTRGDNGRSTTAGITLTVGGPAPIQVLAGQSIQGAIDAAPDGALVTVGPGTYDELVILWKNVRLQGSGAASTIIDGTKTAAKLAAWKAKLAALAASGDIAYVPGQTGLSNLEEGPAVLVVAKAAGFGANPVARVDGFTLTGATNGGGVLVNGYAGKLQIANNRIANNQATFGGGIRIGHPYLNDGMGGQVYADAFNDDIAIHHNEVVANGTVDAAGGGIALYTGADRYRVSDNFVCGNFSARDGGGIGHLGLSDQGLIANNAIVFNQAFQQTAGAGGGAGGILIAGGTPLGTGLSPGAGSVRVESNLIHGNQAGSDDGAGILLRHVNGAEVPGRAAANWYAVAVANNIISNNVTGLAGAVTLQDALRVTLDRNTIANNDSTATAAAAFNGGPAASSPRPAGVVARTHTAGLNNVLPATEPGHANPVLSNNIIWHNRSFYWDVALNNGKGGLVPDLGAGGAPAYDDLAVLGAVARLNPVSCLLTDAAGYGAGNISADPMFVREYFVGGPGHLLAGPDPAIQTIPAFDEGGNFIDLSYGPLTLVDTATGNTFADYHLRAGSPALNGGMGAR